MRKVINKDGKDFIRRIIKYEISLKFERKKLNMCIVCDYNSGEIKSLEGLEILNCSHCPLLTTIPHIEGLKRLHCSHCPLLTAIPHIEGSEVLDCYNCAWLPNKNRDYKNNINSLVKTQRIVKNFIIRRRLKRVKDEILKIYFHPEMKGGYLHKKEMMEMIDKIKAENS